MKPASKGGRSEEEHLLWRPLIWNKIMGNIVKYSVKTVGQKESDSPLDRYFIDPNLGNDVVTEAEVCSDIKIQYLKYFKKWKWTIKN